MPSTPPETARRSLHALPPGTVLHDYVIDSELGSGGFSVVYLARHRLNSDWLFAIKEYLPRELAVRDNDGSSVRPVNKEVGEGFEHGLRRFRDEAEQLRRFRNERYVVSCLNYFEANGTAYLVMDYDDGLPLSEFLRRREAAGQPFTEADLRAVVDPLLEGLEVVHRAGVLHRDIKPGNIFVRRPDDITGRPAQPVLIDFGAAKQNYLSLHSRSQAPYTPGYAAYEQVSSEGEIGPWTDIYAIGALMWRMVAGRCLDDESSLEPYAADEIGDAGVLSPTPLPAERRAYALHQGRADPMASAVELGAGTCSPALLAAIDRCLVLYPEERVQSCAELRSLFDGNGAATGAATSAGTATSAGMADSLKPKAIFWATAGRVAAAGAGLAAVLLVLYAGFFVLRAPESPISLPDAPDNGSTGTLPSLVVDEPVPPSVIGGSAILVVETDPPGVEVLVGETVVGEAPLRLGEMRSGTYPVTLRHPDYEPLRLEDQALEDGVVLRIERTLVRGTGRLTVIAQPADAWVERGGERLAEATPVTLEDLPAGVVELSLGADGHQTIHVRAEVPRDGVGLLEPALESIPYGTLTLELEPPDATVALEGIGTGYEPGMRLPEGEYRIVVSRPGYHAVERTVTVSGEARVRIQLVVGPQPFTVEAAPANATIYLPGVSEAYEPGLLLDPGNYRVDVSAAGYESWSGVVRHRSEPTREIVTLPVLPLGASFMDELSSGGEGPEMVVIPAGRFRMGCVSGGECSDSEFPVHEVAIPQPFAVSKYEATFEDWDACVAGGACGGYHPGDEGWGRGRRPVINVSWDDAREYVAWLSGQTGAEYRLLSEAEWEYAARAGSQTAYSWGNDIGVNRANCGDWGSSLGACGDRWEVTAPVGSFEPNPFGVHDMHGNVWEWVEDCWNGGYAGAPTDGRAWRSGDCTQRVLRGGSWGLPRYLRSAYRNRFTSGNRKFNNGFRVARTLTP